MKDQDSPTSAAGPTDIEDEDEYLVNNLGKAIKHQAKSVVRTTLLGTFLASVVMHS